MRMARPPPYPKKFDATERLFYHYKINPSTFVLFDSDMDTAVAYGSFNYVAGVISKLPKSSTIFYFELHSREGWKMKRSYRPDKTNEESSKAKDRIDEKKSEKQEDV
jgi:hypothetical protein